MPHYEQDDYVQEQVADDAVWANTVASWRVHFDAQDRLERLAVERHNGWIFDSEGGAGVPIHRSGC